MGSINKKKLLVTVQQLIAGIQKRYPDPAEKLAFGGTTTNPAALVALLQGFVALLLGTDAARAAFQARLKDLREQTPALEQQVSAFVAFVRATFGNSPESLLDFGLTPRKTPAPLTVEERALAVQRNLATRVARSTRGPKQKADIRGVVPAPAPATAPEPAAPVTPGASASPVATATTATPSAQAPQAAKAQTGA